MGGLGGHLRTDRVGIGMGQPGGGVCVSPKAAVSGERQWTPSEVPIAVPGTVTM